MLCCYKQKYRQEWAETSLHGQELVADPSSIWFRPAPCSSQQQERCPADCGHNRSKSYDAACVWIVVERESQDYRFESDISRASAKDQFHMLSGYASIFHFQLFTIAPNYNRLLTPPPNNNNNVIWATPQCKKKNDPTLLSRKMRSLSDLSHR